MQSLNQVEKLYIFKVKLKIAIPYNIWVACHFSLFYIPVKITLKLRKGETHLSK
jgi:hypothetical protein